MNDSIQVGAKEQVFGNWLVRPPRYASWFHGRGFAFGVIYQPTQQLLFLADQRKEAIRAAKALGDMEPPPAVRGWPTESDWLDRAAERTKGLKIWWQASGGAPATLFAPEEIIPYLNATRDLHKYNNKPGKKRTQAIKNLESILANRLQYPKATCAVRK